MNIPILYKPTTPNIVCLPSTAPAIKLHVEKKIIRDFMYASLLSLS